MSILLTYRGWTGDRKSPGTWPEKAGLKVHGDMLTGYLKPEPDAAKVAHPVPLNGGVRPLRFISATFQELVKWWTMTTEGDR